MNIHYLQHVPFEDLGSMENYFRTHHHVLSSTQLYHDEPLPSQNDFDWLIVMGGPMGVYDEGKYSWLRAEKAFIKETIASGKRVLGVCLGAQLIAEVMGAQVKKGAHREIGWHPINATEAFKQSGFPSFFPDKAQVFHWHGDMFDIPQHAIPLASSAACPNQGFIFDHRVVGLQFHLEKTYKSASALIEHCSDELDGSTYVQSANTMLEGPQRFDDINEMMQRLLVAVESST